MTTTRHTPIPTSPKAAANAATFNAPLSQLDTAVVAVEADVTQLFASVGSGAGWASTLDGTANSGQKVVPVASTTGAVVGMPVYIGLTSGDHEVAVIGSISAGVSVTLVDDLVETYYSGTPISATPAEVADARGGYATLGERLEARTAQAYGATGDGVTDDTAALRAALDDMPVAPAKGDLYIPPGTYLISDTLDVPEMGWERIHGSVMGSTVIQMTANNKPILRFAHENTSGIVVEDLKLEFATPQAKTNTSAYGIQFYSNPGTGYGFYYNTFTRIWIRNAAIGIGIAGTGVVVIWATRFDSIIISDTSLTAIDLRSPAAGGMPNVLFTDVRILNTGSGIVDPSWAIRLSGVEALFYGLGIEDWCNNGIQVTGNGTPAFRGVHIERHSFTDATTSMFYIANTPVIVEGATFVYCTSVPGVAIARLFWVVDADLILNGVVSRDWTITGGTVESLYGDADSRIYATGCDWGPPGEYLVSGWGPGLYARVLVDGMPPTVDVLPAGAAQFRGRRFRVLGGAGVADVVSECSKNAADAYVWVTK